MNGVQESLTLDRGSPSGAPKICARHLEAALSVTRPSVSAAQRALYERRRDKLLMRSNVTVASTAADTGGRGTAREGNMSGKGPPPERHGGTYYGSGTGDGDNVMTQPC